MIFSCVSLLVLVEEKRTRENLNLVQLYYMNLSRQKQARFAIIYNILSCNKLYNMTRDYLAPGSDG